MGIFNFFKKNKSDQPEQELDAPPMPPPMMASKDQFGFPRFQDEPRLPGFPGSKEQKQDSFADLQPIEEQMSPVAPSFRQFKAPELFPKQEAPSQFNKLDSLRAQARGEPAFAPETRITMPAVSRDEQQMFPERRLQQPTLDIEEEVSTPEQIIIPPKQEPREKEKAEIQVPAGSVYVKLDNFREILHNADFVRKSIKQFDDGIKNMHDLKVKDTEKFEDYKNSLIYVEKRLKILDKKMFR